MRVGATLSSMKLMMLVVLTAGLLVTAAPAAANPSDCVSPDGTPCITADDGGVTVETPGGPSGTAGPDDVSGALPDGPSGEVTPDNVSGGFPGGPSGVVTPDDVSGCIPGLGCLNIPR